ncbi:MAG: dihydroorotate dehydrogenase electron transfer subunit [Chloroflexota bacterium]
MRQDLATVVACEELTPGTFALTLSAPWLTGARPGQFVHVRCGDSDDPLLRRPISIHRVGSANLSPVPFPRREEGQGVRSIPAPGEVSLLFRLVGRGTRWLAARKPGDRVDLMGPLGRGFAVAPNSRRLLLVGGGLGVAPLVMLADEAVARGLSVTLAMGGRAADDIFPGQLLPAEVEYMVTTEDGSLGHKGYVTEVLGEPMRWADEVFACGPLGMLAALKRLPRHPNAAPIQASLEEHMGCAVGVCYGCVVETRHGLRRVCTDGPVFELDEVAL